MKYRTTTAGFSLVEVLVAITILLLVTVGPLRIMTQVNKTNSFSTDQTTAFFLAQEGLELLQVGRDNLVLGDLRDTFLTEATQPNPWTEFAVVFDSCITNGGPNKRCGVVAAANASGYSLTDCGTSLGNCQLYTTTDTNNRRLTHTATGNTLTPYTRSLQVAIIPGPGGRPQGAVATSTVTWRSGDFASEQRVELVTYLTNVYDTN
jgi:prepilin-type N-terminal cleavage/methylation domain-containing protein